MYIQLQMAKRYDQTSIKLLYPELAVALATWTGNICQRLTRGENNGGLYGYGYPS